MRANLQTSEIGYFSILDNIADCMIFTNNYKKALNFSEQILNFNREMLGEYHRLCLHIRLREPTPIKTETALLKT